MLREELAATEAQVLTAQAEEAPPKQLHTAKEGNPSVQVKDVIRETARDAVLQ
uniref:Uncharacterized protein n=1 Tax=Heterorhabditis bacteriophora TaxID=37862 RepID=A0A1I7XIU1_HETBA